MPPRTAFLVLAHAQPQLTARLVARLRADWSHVFIHVDAKTPRKTFTAVVPPGPDVTYVDPISVNWGGFTSVLAMCRLLRAALEAEGAYQRFFMISGADYPLKPIEAIGAALEPEQELLRVDRALSPQITSHFDFRGHRAYFGDSRLLGPRTAPKLVDRVRRVVETRFRRSYPGVIYYGPAWWCLTRPAAEYMVQAVQTPAARWFRFAFIPDEMVFQTLLKQSPFADRIAQDATVRSDLPDVQAGHYVHFPQDETSPKTLDMSDWAALRASPALFARKFDLARSVELMDALDRVIAA